MKNNTERQINFANYFAQVVYMLKATKFAMGMARDYCDGPKKKRMLEIKQHQMQSTILDVTLQLREESWRDMQDDLNGEELQALSNIIHHLIDLNSIAAEEKYITEFIKKLKALQYEELDGKTAEGPAEAGHHSELPGEAAAGKEESIWPTIAKGWQQKQSA